MQKTVIVINGSGGVGKDTLCDIAATHYSVWNISSIDPIKELAAITGWNGDMSVNNMLSKYVLDDPKVLSLLRNSAMLLILAPLLVVYAFAQKYFIQSIERSGLVG
jgi:hypothetical protein